MIKSAACVFVTLVLTTSTAFPAVIDVGTHYFLPNTPNQTIGIYVHGTEDIAGMEFNVQVANGGPELEGIVLEPGEGIDGPGIADVDLVGSEVDGTLTLFGAVPHLLAGPGLTFPQIWMAGIIAEEPGTGIVANGLLATVTFDTTGFFGGSWDLFLSDTHNGPTALFANTWNPQPIPIDWTDGTIVIASGRSAVHDGGFAAGTLEDWTLGGAGTAEVVEFPVGSGNHVAELTAGSEVVLGQEIDTPGGGFLTSFDYAFQSAGSLEIMLGQQSIGLIEAAGPSDFQLARLQIDDPQLMGLSGAELAFRFNGQTGSQVLVDNISVRGIPEPATLVMLLGLLAGMPLVVAWRWRTR